MKRRRYKVKNALVQLLGGKCQRCGYAKSKRALTFHHRDPSDKAFGLAAKTVLSFSRLAEEAKKCDLLCANCHAEVEEELLEIGA